MGYSSMLLGKGFDQPYRSVKEIVNFLQTSNYQTESQIQEKVFGYYRNSTWESNKKYADMLRRGLQKGLYKRILWKKKSDSRNLYYYYVVNKSK
jgi:hypothetical protein